LELEWLSQLSLAKIEFNEGDLIGIGSRITASCDKNNKILLDIKRL
jgi:hypothetical protein